MAVDPPINTSKLRTDHVSDSGLSRDALDAELFNETARVILAQDLTHLTQSQFDAATTAASPTTVGLLSAADKASLDALKAFAIDLASAIDFTPETDSDLGSNAVTLTVQIVTSDGTKIPVMPNTDVTIIILSDTTPGSLAVVNGSASPILVTMVSGSVDIVVTAIAGAGTVTLGLSDTAGTLLDVSDTATAVFT